MSELYEKIYRLMSNQSYAVLCTQGNQQPYGSIIAFAANNELNAVVFATPISSHKYRLLCECKQVALVVDNRSDNPTGDNSCIEALTITGQAVRLSKDDDRQSAQQILIQKHLRMNEFMTSQHNAFFRVDVHRYLHVTHFNRVNEWFPPHAA